MITWWGLPKIADGQGLPKQAEALQSPRVHLTLKYGGGQYTTVLCVNFGCLTSYYHHRGLNAEEKKVYGLPMAQ